MFLCLLWPFPVNVSLPNFENGSIIDIDAQDAQDYQLMAWAACSWMREFIPLDPTIAFSSTRIPETGFQDHQFLPTRTRSLSKSASFAGAFHPVNPVYRCFFMQPTGLPFRVSALARA